MRTREPEVSDGRRPPARPDGWRSAAQRPRDRGERVGDGKAAALPHRKEAREAGGGPAPGVGLRGLPPGQGQPREGVARPLWARLLRPLGKRRRSRGRGSDPLLSAPRGLLSTPGSCLQWVPLGFGQWAWESLDPLARISLILELRHEKGTQFHNAVTGNNYEQSS